MEEKRVIEKGTLARGITTALEDCQAKSMDDLGGGTQELEWAGINTI